MAKDLFEEVHTETLPELCRHWAVANDEVYWDFAVCEEAVGAVGAVEVAEAGEVAGLAQVGMAYGYGVEDWECVVVVAVADPLALEAASVGTAEEAVAFAAWETDTVVEAAGIPGVVLARLGLPELPELELEREARPRLLPKSLSLVLGMLLGYGISQEPEH